MAQQQQSAVQGLTSRRNAVLLLRVLACFLAVAIALPLAVRRYSAREPRISSRRTVDLMYDAHCVPLKKHHLDVTYIRDDACFSRRQVQQILTDLVLDASAVFDAYNLTYFLDSGTLLGSYRNGSVIPHDQDADMGIDERSFEFIQKNQIELPAKYALHVLDSEIHADGYRDKELPARVVHTESALYIDLFVYIDSYNATAGGNVTGPLPSVCFTPSKCYSCPQVGPRQWQFQVPYEWIYPLQSCPFGSGTLNCPAQPEKYLRFMFGDDFMTPDTQYVEVERSSSPPLSISFATPLT